MARCKAQQHRKGEQWNVFENEMLIHCFLHFKFFAILQTLSKRKEETNYYFISPHLGGE